MGKFKLRNLLVTVGVLSLMMVGGWLTVWVPQAEASTFGRSLEYGYYDGKRYTLDAPDYYWYSYMFEQGLPSNWETTRTTVDIFIDDLQLKLSSSSSVIDQARASAIINTMMGVQAQDNRYDRPQSQRYQNGITLARSQFNEWERIVRAYDRCSRPGQGGCTIPGASVNFNEILSLDDTINGYGVGETGGDPQIPDIVFAPIGGSAEDMIVFRHANGTSFTIKKKCGNLTGEQSSFPTSPPSGELNPPTSNPGVPPGFTPGDPAVTSSCSRITGWARDPNNAAYPVPVTVRYSIGGGPAVALPTVNASATSPFAFGVDTPAAIRNSTQSVRITAEGVAANGTPFTLDNSPMTIGPCRIITAGCSGITPIPTSIDPGTQYRITARVSYGNAPDAATILGQPGGVRFFINIQGPGVNTLLPNVVPIVNEGNGVLSATTPLQPPTGQAGTYNVSYGIVAATGSITCSGGGPINPGDTFPVSNKPYFQVNGGDISAGAGMTVGGIECAAAGGVRRNDEASIVGWNRGASGSYGGAGTQYAALALNRLQGFATGQGSGLAPTGLSFANTGGTSDQVDTGRELYGGEFGGAACTADYFENATGEVAGPRLLSTLLGVATGSTYVVPNNARTTFYVRDNVQIDVNVRFDGSTAGYPNAAAIPVFSVVAEGNIYISPDVTQLDGFYIAQPTDGSATNGIIYTCSTANYTPATLTRSLQANCNTALTVNGAFVARQVWLLRTAGSLSSTPAEVFNYTPELWANAPFGNSFSSESDDYDAITSLPPVL